MRNEGQNIHSDKIRNLNLKNNKATQNSEPKHLEQRQCIGYPRRMGRNPAHVENKQQRKRWEELIKFVNCHTHKLKQCFEQECPEDIQQINLHYLKLEWKLGHFLGRLDLPALNKIDLTENLLGPKGIQLISKSNWPNLEVLDLKNNQIKDEGFKYLIKGKWPKLENLTINSNKVKCMGMMAIRYCQWFNLKQLYLRGNRIGLRGISVLTKINIIFLNTLDIGNCGLGLEAMKKLARANWQQLILLNLAMNFIGDEGIRILSKSNWPKLQYLQLQYNEIRGGLRLLRGRWPQMRFPFLYGNRATVEMIQDTVSTLIVKQ